MTAAYVCSLFIYLFILIRDAFSVKQLPDSNIQPFEFGNGNKIDEAPIPQENNINQENVKQNPKAQPNSNYLGKQKASSKLPNSVRKNSTSASTASVRISNPSSSGVIKSAHANVFQTPARFNGNKRRRPRSLLNSPVDVINGNHIATTMPTESEPTPTPTPVLPVEVGVENGIQCTANQPAEPDPLATTALHVEVLPNNQ
ncbi:hypothetical protein PIB30_032320 [Stylosanthes scabra]|uniref:Uncharacterized protein n=1 Tax=Stylosanthes scabra TaxID=79078 RepID=A0ABU6RCB4_9FABA|nr:hypothetical protein [Stylosanthes scabra]